MNRESLKSNTEIMFYEFNQLMTVLVDQTKRMNDNLEKISEKSKESSRSISSIEVMPHDLDGEYTFKEAIEAAKECTYAGHTGWRLPTKYELNELYKDKETIGGFKPDIYWSSTETHSYPAWNQDFSNGFQGSNNKDSSYRVRCLRDI